MTLGSPCKDDKARFTTVPLQLYLINILYFNSVAFWFITFTKFSFYTFKSVRRPKSVKGKRRNICSLGQIVIKSKRSEGLKPRDYRLPSFKSVYYF